MAIMTFQGDGIERISEDTVQLGLVGCWWKERNTGIDCIYIYRRRVFQMAGKSGK